MSIKLTQLVWNTEINLMPSEKFVLLFLANCANDQKNYLCYPSINTIGKHCNLSRSHVKRILNNLSSLNIIQKIPNKLESNNFKSNYYIINEEVILGRGGFAQEPRGGFAQEPRVGSPRNPYNINDNETIKKENNIKERPLSVPQEHPSSVLRNTAKLVIDFLKLKTGRNYQHVDTTLKPIMRLLKEGVTLEQCKQVIVRKHRDWGRNKEMEKYLRPSTLFNKNNFYNKYLPELVTEEDKKNNMKKP